METHSEPRVFHALDLDRTLFNTARMAATMQTILEEQYPALARLVDEELENAREQGVSYQLYDRIATVLSEDEVRHFEALFMQNTPSDALLLPGAIARMAYAASRPEWQRGIITYGSPEGQRWKLKMAGLDNEQFLVVDTPRKGNVIASWVLDRGGFLLPKEFGGGEVDTIVFDDDKLIAFEDLPEGAYGNWVHATGTVPEKMARQVVRTATLYNAIERTNSLLE